MIRLAGDDCHSLKSSAWGRLACCVLGLCLLSAALATADDDSRELFRTGQYEEAIDAAKAETRSNVFNETAWLIRLRSNMELGRYGAALEAFEEGLKSLPNSIQVRWAGLDVLRYNGQQGRVGRMKEELANLVRQSPWRYSDTANQLTLGRFLLAEEVDPKRVLDDIYGVIKRRQPGFSPVHVAAGDLALSRNDFALAAKSYEQANKLDDDDPDIHYGLARAFADSDSSRAEKELNAVLGINPRHTGALLMIVDSHIDAERYEAATAFLAQIARTNSHHPLAAAYATIIAHLKNQEAEEKRQHDLALAFYPTNPEVDYLIGKKLSQKYRFAEAVVYQRQSIELDGTYLPSRLQLAQDLLRLGEEDIGWKLANDVAKRDEYNVVAHNLVELERAIRDFRTLEEDGLMVRMDAREAEIYGDRVLDLLRRARKTLTEKYEVQLPTPIIVELFPKQQDFAIRTFGLPGGAGFLGVCFGTVITANSPASQGETPASWEATLWHEFCHVVTLNKTRNRMPRWLSEGISVYEEARQDPSWGQALSPQYRQMILGDDLTPVSHLSGAFLHVKSPLHLQFAYFESALVVEYLVEKHGIETLKSVLTDLGEGVTINDSLSRHVGSLDELDKSFADYARARANALAPQADWSKPELPQRAGREQLMEYLVDHPNNLTALKRLAALQIAEQDWNSAAKTVEKLRELYPEDRSADGGDALQAALFRHFDRTHDERLVLERLADRSANSVDVFARIAALAAKEGDWPMVRRMALRWLAVNPLQPAPHRLAGQAAEQMGDAALEAESCEALLKLDPTDPAELHLKLATALEKSGDFNDARRHALLALEETPRFRRGYERLFSILNRLETPGGADRPPSPPEAVLSDKPAPAKKSAGF